MRAGCGDIRNGVSEGKKNCCPKTEQLDVNSRHGKPTPGQIPSASLLLPAIFCQSHLCRLYIVQHKMCDSLYRQVPSMASVSFRTPNPHTHHSASHPHLPNLRSGLDCFSICNIILIFLWFFVLGFLLVWVCFFFLLATEAEHVACSISAKQEAL